MRRLLLPSLLLLLSAAPARAHDADVLQVRVRHAPDGRVEERLTLVDAALLPLAPVDRDGDGRASAAELAAGADALALGVWDAAPVTAVEGGRPCVRESSEARRTDVAVELRARLRCPPGALQQRFTLLEVLPPTFTVVLGRWEEGAAGAWVADARSPTLPLPAPAGTPVERDAVAGLGAWVALGVHHILSGVDHLAFLVALLLGARAWRRVLLLVTAFTLGHAASLVATALGLVWVGPSRAAAVEVAIALSVVWVAVENVLRRGEGHRPALALGFGLVHGLGFAGALAEEGLGRAPLVGLLGFNVGVELGQAAVVAALLPLLHLAQRRPRLDTWGVRTASLLLVAAGAYWCLVRSFTGG